MAAIRATGAGKAVGEDAAFEIAAEFALRCRWGSLTGALIVKRQPRRQVRLNSVIEQRTLGLAAAIDGAAR